MVRDAKRILITGHKGYIGSLLAPHLLRAGYEVVGLDTDYCRGCSLLPEPGPVPGIERDLRDLQRSDVVGFDAVIHLAALSGEPLGALDRDSTRQINFEGTVRLAEFAKRAGVRRFVFASTCLVYDPSGAGAASEQAPVAFSSDYAAAKIKSERALHDLAGDGFSPTVCRLGSVYGLSPRMRFDTLLNDVIGRAAATGRTLLRSGGTASWAVIQVQDLCRALQAVLEAPREAVHDEVFNLGAEHLNIRSGDLAALVLEAVPGCDLGAASPEPNPDQRSLALDCAKFRRAFPTFRFLWSPRQGARELAGHFRAIGLTRTDVQDPRFSRLSWMSHLVQHGILDASLRWPAAATEAA
jgi:nucleoside-diphosphate-sugar epimerase